MDPNPGGQSSSGPENMSENSTGPSRNGAQGRAPSPGESGPPAPKLGDLFRDLSRSAMDWLRSIEMLAAAEGRFAGRQFAVGAGLGLAGLLLLLFAWAGGGLALIMLILDTGPVAVAAWFGGANLILSAVCFLIAWKSLRRPFFQATRRQIFSERAS